MRADRQLSHEAAAGEERNGGSGHGGGGWGGSVSVESHREPSWRSFLETSSCEMHTGDFYIAHVKSTHLDTRVLENSTLSTISLNWESVFMPFLGLQFLGSYLCLSKTSRSFSLLAKSFH